MTTDAPPLPTLSPAALDALRTIAEHGTDQDKARAHALLIEYGVARDPDAETRAELRAGGPMLFGERLMPETFTAARSPLHDELNAFHLREAEARPGQREAVAAPRGHGKTTAGVEVPAIWHAANCTRRFQVIISDTDDQAKERLAAIKAHVEDNERLGELYPKLRASYASRMTLDERTGTWRANDLVFACGCRISARGAGKSMRGMKHKDRRPDLLYLDDLEDEGSVSTPYQIEKRLRWLTRVALGLAGPLSGMSVLWVGTILTRDALLNLATGAALDEGQTRPAWASSWIARVYRAELDGTPKIPTTATVTDPDTGATFTLTRDVGEPMWSELTREKLVQIRGQLGDESYAAEYLADPVEGTDGLVRDVLPVSFVNPDAPPAQRVVRLPNGGIVPVASMVRTAALDPQFAEANASSDPDLAAIACVGLAGPYAIILDSWVGRDKGGQAARLVTMATAWGCFAAAVEVVAAQVLVADQAAQLSRLPIVREPATEGKEARALKVGVYSQQQRLLIAPTEGHNKDLPAYLRAFPHGRYKDPMDAVVMALNVAARSAPVASSGGLVVGGSRAT